jgi:hypothetical protein
MGTKGRSVEFFTALLKNVRYALGMANTGG